MSNIASFQIYGLYIVIGIIISLAFTFILSKENHTGFLMFSALIILFGFICSRTIFCITNYSYFIFEIEKPMAMLYFWDGGFSMIGLLLGIELAFLINSKINLINNINRLKNSFYTAFGLFIALERFAEGYTNVGIGKYINTNNDSIFIVKDELDFASIAVFRIEAAIAIIIFLVLLYFFTKKWKNNLNFPYFKWAFLLIFSTSQIVLESLRNDGHMVLGFVHLQQLIYAFIPIILLIFINNKIKNISKYSKFTIISPMIIAIIMLVDIALEFSLDGRLFININLFNMSEMLRDYLIMCLGSIIMLILGTVSIKHLYSCTEV